MSFREGAVACMLDNPKTFLFDCKAPQSPAVRVAGLDFRDFGKECVNTINLIRKTEKKPPLKAYEAEECAADSDSKVNYEYNRDVDPNEFHKQESGDAQNTCPPYSSIDDILDDCVWKDMYLHEKQNYLKNPGGCYHLNWPDGCGHYYNMVVDPDLNKVACGLYETPKGEWWTTQNFYR
jgi:hypothetical protein